MKVGLHHVFEWLTAELNQMAQHCCAHSTLIRWASVLWISQPDPHECHVSPQCLVTHSTPYRLTVSLCWRLVTSLIGQVLTAIFLTAKVIVHPAFLSGNWYLCCHIDMSKWFKVQDVLNEKIKQLGNVRVSNSTVTERWSRGSHAK